MTGSNRLWVTTDARLRGHRGPPDHPERPARLDAVDRALASLEAGVHMLPARFASDDEILAVHSPALLEQLRGLSGRSAQIDSDTYMAPESFDLARLAAGSVVELALQIARSSGVAGFAGVRPPGHHAERDQAMGFCLLNQVAMAAAALRHEGIERIAIVDWDVHHGNGTQHIFEHDPNTLFVSLHQFPFYPGSGSLAERGVGPGEGATVNLPLPAGCGDAEYGAVFDAVVIPILAEFRPEIVLVSAGFDAHADDPLAGMKVSSTAFAGWAAQLRDVAEHVAGGRLVLALEGGYAIDALAASLQGVLRVLAAEAPDVPKRLPMTPLGQRCVELFRQAHGATFTSLRAASAR